MCDLVIPVIVLIITCVLGMIYSGGFFSGTNFIEAFSNSDASVGLVIGSFAAIIFTVVFYLSVEYFPLNNVWNLYLKALRQWYPLL